MTINLRSADTAEAQDADYEVESIDTVGVDVTTASTTVDVHPELAMIRNRLAHGSISTTEIREALVAADPELLGNLRAAKADADRRRAQRR